MQRQATNLTRLVDDLLTVSRIEATALDVHREVVKLRAAATQSMETFTERMSEIRLTMPAGLAILADPDHLQRILVNYVTNALKYGAPPIEVMASPANEWIEIRVSDSGKGVPPEFVPHLFERFARADAVRTAQPGTGLGLSIVKGLAEANGGDAWYEPGRPRGSCFVVRLPKAVA
jgi:signal transduction histidine kinase